MVMMDRDDEEGGGGGGGDDDDDDDEDSVRVRWFTDLVAVRVVDADFGVVGIILGHVVSLFN